MPRPNPELRNVNVMAVYTSSSGFSSTAVRSALEVGRRWTGQNTPNYFIWANVPHGLPANDHESYISKRDNLRAHRYRYDVNQPSQWDDYYDLLPYMELGTLPDRSYDITHSAEALTAATYKCIGKIKGMKINMAQAYAEAQKTMNTVGDTAMTLAATIRKLRKGDLAGAARALGVAKPQGAGKSIANKWLALQYGWLPLLNDVKGAAEHLARRQTPPVFKFRGKAKSVDPGDVLSEVKTTTGAGVLVERHRDYSCEVEVMCAFQLGNATAQELSQTGITDPLLLAWELLPYSFVVDWFFPVGRFLQSIGYDTGLIFRMGYITKFSKNVRTTTLEGSSTLNGNLRTVWDAGLLLHASNFYLTRTRLLAPPAVPLPEFKNPLSPTHMLNGLALLAKACK